MCIIIYIICALIIAIDRNLFDSISGVLEWLSLMMFIFIIGSCVFSKKLNGYFDDNLL